MQKTITGKAEVAKALRYLADRVERGLFDNFEPWDFKAFMEDRHKLAGCVWRDGKDVNVSTTLVPVAGHRAYVIAVPAGDGFDEWLKNEVLPASALTGRAG